MLIKVKVTPEADQAEVLRKGEDEFKVKVREKPEQGRANRAVTRALADYLNLEENEVRLVKGGKRRNKIFKVPD